MEGRKNWARGIEVKSNLDDIVERGMISEKKQAQKVILSGSEIYIYI